MGRENTWIPKVHLDPDSGKIYPLNHDLFLLQLYFIYYRIYFSGDWLSDRNCASRALLTEILPRRSIEECLTKLLLFSEAQGTSTAVESGSQQSVISYAHLLAAALHRY